MREPVHLPELGAEPVRLGQWLVHVGEAVQEGDRLVEVLLGAAVVEIAAPASGRLAVVAVRSDEPLQPGQVLGYIDMDGG